MSTHVLLVEDDEALAEVVATLLRDEGVAVEVQGDGRRVVGMVAHRLPDVVVLDVSLRTADGTVVARALRAAWPELPIIFATGSVHVDDMRARWGDQRTSVLQKPFEIETLVRAIEMVMVAA